MDHTTELGSHQLCLVGLWQGSEGREDWAGDPGPRKLQDIREKS